MNTVKTFLIALCLITTRTSFSCNSEYIEINKEGTVFAGVPETAQKSWGELANQLIAVIWDCRLDEQTRVKKMRTITEIMSKLEKVRCQCEIDQVVKVKEKKDPSQSEVKGQQ